MRRQMSYLGAALRHRASFWILGGGAVTAMATGSDVPLLLAGGVELVFLGAITGNARFQQAVDAREAKKQAKLRSRQNEKLLAELAPNQREHFLGLQALASRIQENFGRLDAGGEAIAAQSRLRIDALLQSFLRLLLTLNDHRRYLGGTDRQLLERELRELQVDLAGGAAPPAVREIKERRVAILGKRLERFEKAQESREVIAHQLASIEDLLRLLHEQSITLRDPAGVTHQLDALAIEVEEAESTVRELDRLLAFDLELRALGQREAS